MNKERLKEIYLEQNEDFEKKHNLIFRDIGLDKYISTEQVVVISGVRRSGKSSLLWLIKEKMRLKPESYSYFNFDDERIITDIFFLEDLYNLHIEIYGKTPVFFWDEIQNVPGWEKFINRMYEKEMKIFVTGSNASLLSSEISSSLTGRNRLLEIYPFSFSEYLRFRKKKYSLERLTSASKALLMNDLNEYIAMGGFPLVLKENDLEIVHHYFQDILYRDIIARYRLSQIEEIKQIAVYFCSNVSKLFSYSTLQAITRIKSRNSISNYLSYFQQAHLFIYLKKFDYSIKKQMKNSKKVYVIDLGFAHRIGFNFSGNKGRVLENVIFIELLRRKQEIFYYKGKNECDFVVREGLKISTAIQVTWTLDFMNLKRELNGLMEAVNTFELKSGLIVYMNLDVPLSEIPKNVELVPAWKFLLQFKKIN
ncbi:MAG: ATP-binding protein [Candidatus Marinimicrobia bacterium]|nr:ATP-binding protein [Candidatus Neomarinimicrobiota bacterium]